MNNNKWHRAIHSRPASRLLLIQPRLVPGPLVPAFSDGSQEETAAGTGLLRGTWAVSWFAARARGTSSFC